MATFGGIIKLRLPTGQNLSVRGNVSHKPSNMTFDKVANHDGTVNRTAAPSGFGFSMALANVDAEGNPVDVAALMALEDVSFMFLHDSERVDRVYSKAFLTGDVSVDDATGEISGLEGVAQGFLETKR